MHFPKQAVVETVTPKSNHAGIEHSIIIIFFKNDISEFCFSTSSNLIENTGTTEEIKYFSLCYFQNAC